MIDRLCWLSTLITAANLFIDSQENERETAQLLINYGRRRGKQFLSPPKEYHRLFFGLGNPCVAAALTASCDLERGIENYRQVAKFMLSENRKPLIVYVEIIEGAKYAEFSTAIKDQVYQLHICQMGLLSKNLFMQDGFSPNFHARLSLVESIAVKIGV